MKASQFYPQNILKPIKDWLLEREQKLTIQRKNIDGESGTSDDNVSSDAAVDTGAWRRFGQARMEAVTSEMDKMLIRVRKALTKIKVGKYGLCEDCGKMIDTDRLAVDPTSPWCVSCAAKHDGDAA